MQNKQNSLVKNAMSLKNDYSNIHHPWAVHATHKNLNSMIYQVYPPFLDP